jgi:hypothetical protein
MYYQQPMPYQNYQAQQRQEQFTRSYNYNFVQDITEAQNWAIAPGNHLVFEDANGKFFYTKSLGFAPNDRPVFQIFKRDDQVRTEEPKSEVDSLKSDIAELKKLFEQFTRKGGGK